MIHTGTTKSGQYRLAYTKDPALVLPAGEKERDRALEVARETQKYAAITAEGQRLTLFTMRRLNREKYMQWFEAVDEHGQRRFGKVYWYVKLAKLALVDVEDLTEGAKVRRVKDKDFGDAADESCFDGIDPDLTMAILYDLGQSVFMQESFAVPK